MGKIIVSVHPGICGFECRVSATRQSKQSAIIEILGSDCSMIQQLAKSLSEITVQDLFTPHTKNVVFRGAEQAHCHLCCPVPIAIIKATEVVLELALPKDVLIRFEKSGSQTDVKSG